MKISFDHNFQKKVMVQRFDEPVTITKDSDVLAWRAAWMGELKSWHSPYKALIDCTNLTIASGDESVNAALARLIKFFEGFFLKKAVGVGFDEAKGHAALPFEVHAEEDKALQEVGLAKGSLTSKKGDFRSSIQLQNHFKQHCVELTFGEEAHFDTAEKIAILKSKLSNNLMQWHSKWNLLIDVQNLSMSTEVHADFDRMINFFKALFLKRVIGYNNLKRLDFPFETFRARHKAAAELEGEGNFSGDEAECRSGTPKGK